jgi:hypothetical protein
MHKAQFGPVTALRGAQAHASDVLRWLAEALMLCNTTVIVPKSTVSLKAAQDPPAADRGQEAAWAVLRLWGRPQENRSPSMISAMSVWAGMASVEVQWLTRAGGVEEPDLPGAHGARIARSA